MIAKSSKLISGLLAFAVYFTMIGLLVYYFNTHESKKSVHYVKKNEERIRVSMTTPAKVLKPKPKAKAKPKKKPKSKAKAKSTKKIIKEKVVKKVKKIVKKRDENLTKHKKINNPKKLFDTISLNKPKKSNLLKETKKPDANKHKQKISKVSHKTSASELISSSLKIQKQSDSGIKKAYFAKIEEKLRGWPAQSEYAGERAKVWFRVQPSGYFKFKVITTSGNDNFNRGLIAYLKQLQNIGFGRHKGHRAYELDVEFVATE